MNKYLSMLLALLCVFGYPVLADVDTFQLTTDASGNVTATENVPFGTMTLKTFVANYSFANIKVKVDGRLVFDQATTANVKVTLTNAAAKSKFELIGTGGPASTTVTSTIEYIFSPTATDNSRDTDTFQLTTDANGNVTATENVPFGTLTLKTFVVNYDFANVKVKVDGKLIFDKAVTANVKVALTGAAAKSKFELIGTGGPANTTATCTIEYAFSPYRDASQDAPSSSRDTDTFQLTTDKDGYVAASEGVPFGKMTLQTFTVNYNFGNLKIKVDDKVVFNKAVLANVKETVNASARKKFEIIASGGPGDTAVTVNIVYTFSPFKVLSDVWNYCGLEVVGETDLHGDLHIRDKGFELCHASLLQGVTTSLTFKELIIAIDGIPLVCELVEPGFYAIKTKIEAGQHSIDILAIGGMPQQKANFVFLFKE